MSFTKITGKGIPGVVNGGKVPDSTESVVYGVLYIGDREREGGRVRERECVQCVCVCVITITRGKYVTRPVEYVE